MEAETTTSLKTRKPLSDCTNTDFHTPASSQSSPSKPELSSASKKSLTRAKPCSETRSSDNSTKIRKPLSDCTNTDAHTHASSQSFPSKPKLSSASNKSLTRAKPGPETRSSHNSVNQGHDLNTSSPPEPSIASTPEKVSSVDGTGDDIFKAYTVYSSRRNSNKRKGKGKEVAGSFSSMPMPKALNKGTNSVEVEHMDLRKSLTEPCGKKQRSWSSEEDLSKNPALQGFIKKQQAYFKEIDEFELLEE